MDRTVIYRKSDRLIVGYVMPPHSVTVEIQNLCVSELGGVPGDYVAVDCPDVPKGMELIISVDGTPELIPDRVILEKTRVRNAAIAKIKATTGLTDVELFAVLPNS
jgi:hypothetical protein